MNTKYKDLIFEQKKRLLLTFFTYVTVAAVILIWFSATLFSERAHVDESWSSYLTDKPEDASLAADVTFRDK